MEVKESERIVIAKPVASRPTISTFRSFSELLAGAINSSPPNLDSEITVAAIRPKTVRFRPTLNHAPQAEMIDTLMGASTIVHRPLAKLVSKTTVSLLLANNMVNPVSNNQQEPQALRAMDPNQDKQNFTTRLSANLNQNVQSRTATIEDDPKALPPAKASADRPSYDGYNWRKYGQKQVKGSEYPRSYYKCTHPSCPVKKKVEKSLDGQIAEIVYKGEHNHSKPQPPKRSALGTETTELGADGSEGRVENRNEVGLPTHYGNAVGSSYNRLGNGVAIPDDSCGLSVECEEENEERGSKRRKKENQANEEPRIVVQSSTDTEIAGDGFRWRKYGQKVVKGSPYPRSYYRCTSQKCSMRKHVERASEDPKAFITTYEGKHNHGMPLRSSNAAGAAAEQDSQVATKDKS